MHTPVRSAHEATMKQITLAWGPIWASEPPPRQVTTAPLAWESYHSLDGAE